MLTVVLVLYCTCSPYCRSRSTKHSRPRRCPARRHWTSPRRSSTRAAAPWRSDTRWPRPEPGSPPTCRLLLSLVVSSILSRVLYSVSYHVSYIACLITCIILFLTTCLLADDVSTQGPQAAEDGAEVRHRVCLHRRRPGHRHPLREDVMPSTMTPTLITNS